MVDEENKPEVELSGIDGNVFAIMGRVKTSMNKFYDTRAEANTKFAEYQKEAESGDYDHLLQTTMKYCEVS